MGVGNKVYIDGDREIPGRIVIVHQHMCHSLYTVEWFAHGKVERDTFEGWQLTPL